MCSPNWFGRFYHKDNDVPEMWKIENFLQISIFQSLGCFVNEIWKIENLLQISIFQSHGCFVNKIENSYQISIFYSVGRFVKNDLES